MSILYINEAVMRQIGLMDNKILESVWEKLADGLVAFGEGRANLPLDSYLRTPSDLQFDRIIAKSGVVEEIAGLKWIASAPLNTKKGLPRATGLLILNDIVTGFVYSILDAVPISNVRTAGCSILFLKHYRPNFKRAVIFGAGVHGREHLRQLLYGKKAGHFPHLEEICVYDLFQVSSEKFSSEYTEDIKVLGDLAEVPEDDTAIIYCTNALVPHIGAEYVKGYQRLTSVHMSLRDYTPEGLAAFDYCVADSAPHVAKAKTSVDLAVQAGLLDFDSIYELPKLLIAERKGEPNPFPTESNVVFNPMGLGSHDLVLGRHVYELTKAKELGIELPV